MQQQQVEPLGPEALQAALGRHPDVVTVLALGAQARVGEAGKALRALALALVEVVPDRADQAVALALDALERLAQHPVGLPGPVGVGA